MAEDSTPQLLGSIPKNSPAHRRMVSSLKQLRDSATSDADAKMYDDIINGRRPTSDILGSGHFNSLATRGFQRYQEERAELTDQELEEVDKQAAIQAQTFFDADE